MRKFLFATAAIALFATGASAETTIYQPVSQSRNHTGYAETQVDYNRMRVSFSGRAGSSRETVEANLLYRAAELTLQRGYDFFVIVDHNVEATSEFQTVGPPLPPIAPRRYREEVRYDATSDILLFHGATPVNTPAAFDARAITANFATQIQRPS
jgi:hypothetical protein